MLLSMPFYAIYYGAMPACFSKSIFDFYTSFLFATQRPQRYYCPRRHIIISLLLRLRGAATALRETRMRQNTVQRTLFIRHR